MHSAIQSESRSSAGSSTRGAASAACVLTALALVACGGAEGGPASGGDGGGLADSGGGSLGEPTAVFPEDFGAVQTVRELDDGTVLVADPLGNALYRVDMGAGTRTQIGAVGQGPQEYRQPDAVWPLPGDSTLLVDLGNGRLVALGPELEFGPTSPLSSGDPRTGMVVAIPRAVDSAGRIYAQALGGGMRGQLPDSGAVLRVERGSLVVDTVAMVKREDVVRSESGGPDGRSVSIEPIPLSPEDAWGAGPDGSVVIARSGDYHVEWHAPDGSVTVGEAVAFDPVAIGTAEKEEWVLTRGRGGGGLSVRVMMSDAGVQTSFGRGGGGGSEREVDDYRWPETMPPFQGGAVLVDPRDRAWVRRHVEAGAETTYDVFDREARRIATYTLGPDRSVVGFGEDAVYAVAYDELDLSWLERYALPD